MSKKRTTRPLPPPIKAWIKALRSGKYKQGTGFLHTADDKFCCLGVACDLAVKKGIIRKPTKSIAERAFEDYEVYRYGNLSGLLPKKVMNWLGLSYSAGDFTLGPTEYFQTDDSLAAMNDSGVSFKKIADFIEKNYWRLLARSTRQ
jgi:hypothetical protein